RAANGDRRHRGGHGARRTCRQHSGACAVAARRGAGPSLAAGLTLHPHLVLRRLRRTAATFAAARRGASRPTSALALAARFRLTLWRSESRNGQSDPRRRTRLARPLPVAPTRSTLPMPRLIFLGTAAALPQLDRANTALALIDEEAPDSLLIDCGGDPFR